MAMLLPLLIGIAGAQGTPQAAPATATEGQTVIVTAKRLTDLQASLADCIARRCPPDKEIDATLAVAERQFVDGDYDNALKTVARGVSRNRKHAASYPVPASDMHRSYARIGVHMGLPKVFRLATFDTLGALRRGLSDTDDRVLSARIELADMYLRTGDMNSARHRYRSVANDAAALDRPFLVGLASVRLLSVAEVTGYRDRDAEEALAKLARDPATAPFALTGKLIGLRKAADRGDAGAVDALIAALPRGGTRPVLIYSPPLRFESVPDVRQPVTNTVSFGSDTLITSLDGQWIDVGLWIAPDGRVSEVSILRKSPEIAGDWSDVVRRIVGGRRYTPFPAEVGDPGVFRVERHSFTADVGRTPTSRVTARIGPFRIEMLDLTDDTPAPTPSP